MTEFVEPESNEDVRAAYQHQVAGHADLLASSWLTDWGKLAGTFCQQTGLTTSEALLFQILLYLKSQNTKLAVIGKELAWLHAHYHNLEIENCPILEFYNTEPWKE